MNKTNTFTSDHHCYFCFINELGLCDTCLKAVNVCLNCIAYGRGGYCINCIENGDEAVSMDTDFQKIIRWIQQNDHYYCLVNNVVNND